MKMETYFYILVTDILDYYLKHLYKIQFKEEEKQKNDGDDHRSNIVLSRLVANVLGDHYIKCPANLFANLLREATTETESSPNIYQYYWTYKGNQRTSAFWNTFSNIWCGEWMGACHSFEMFALFGAPFLNQNNNAFNTDDRIVSMKTIQMVSYFVHNRFVC